MAQELPAPHSSAPLVRNAAHSTADAEVLARSIQAELNSLLQKRAAISHRIRLIKKIILNLGDIFRIDVNNRDLLRSLHPSPRTLLVRRSQASQKSNAESVDASDGTFVLPTEPPTTAVPQAPRQSVPR
jgi:hypothetical protein